MSKVEIEINNAGIQALLKGEEMQSVLSTLGNQCVANAGSGFECDVQVGKTRANASIRPVTKKAKRSCLKNNTLLKAVKSL